MPDFMPDMLCVSKYEIPALLSKIEAELYKELETNLFPYNENANDKIVSFEYKGIDPYGVEDQGSDLYSVILIRNPYNHSEQYHIKFQGWYASYNGAEYEGWSFVEPKQKTITFYS